MRHTVAVLVLVAVASTACSHGHADLRKPSTQDDFGVQMAKMNLWREAMFRFQRAVEINPGDAMAHNNLAVAYEANGDFEKAAREYREALKLDRSNQFIQKNYSRYTEFMARNRKRQQREEKAAGGARPAPAGSTTAATAASSAPAASSPNPPAANAPAATTASSPSPAPTSAGTASAPPASTSTPPPPAPPQTNPPAQNPNPQTPPAQTPPPSNPTAAPPSNSPGGSR